MIDYPAQGLFAHVLAAYEAKIESLEDKHISKHVTFSYIITNDSFIAMIEDKIRC